MIISVHVRKSGGSTFRNALLEYYGERLHLDYGDEVGQTNVRARFKRFKGNIAKHQSIKNNVEIIHGHFYAQKYKHYAAQYAIILRDPVERVLSNYYYLKRVYENRKNTDADVFKKNPDLTLEEYIVLPDAQNLQFRTLDGMDLKEFKFVGLTEDMENSVALYNNIFNAKLVLTNSVNTNPDRGKSYIINKTLRSKIENLNTRDMELYQEAKSVFQSMKSDRAL